MKKTNFDRYLAEQMEDPAFAARFKQAGDAWDVALQLAALREQAGLSQRDMARKLKTSQQQISRLESPGYEGHSLSMLRRVAKVLHARVRVVLEADDAGKADALAEDPVPYRVKRPPISPHEEPLSSHFRSSRREEAQIVLLSTLNPQPSTIRQPARRLREGPSTIWRRTQ